MQYLRSRAVFSSVRKAYFNAASGALVRFSKRTGLFIFFTTSVIGSFGFAPQVAHAYFFPYFTGFETGTASAETAGTIGTASIQSTVARTGTYALEVNPTGTATGYITINGAGDSSQGYQPQAAINPQYGGTVYNGFYFRYATKPAAGSEPILVSTDNNGEYGASLVLNSDGTITVRGSAFTAIGPALATSTTALSADTWYLIEFKAWIPKTSGAYELRINGNTEASGTSNFLGHGWRTVRFGKFKDLGGNSVDFFYDDIYQNLTGFTGPHAVQILLPNGAGGSSGFNNQAGTSCVSADCYQSVDDVPSSVTTYVVSTGSDTTQSFGVDDTSTDVPGSTINGVSVYERVNEDTSGTSVWQFYIKSSSASTTPSLDIGSTGSTNRIWVLPTDPATGSAWTSSILDSAEIGCAEGSGGTVRVRCSDMYLMVDYVPLPKVTTDIATAVGATSALPHATIDYVHGSDASEHGFAYSTDATLSSGVSTTTLGSFSGTGYFNDTLNSLSGGVTYYFRAYATNDNGTGFGSIMSFTTGTTTPNRKIILFEGYKLKFQSGKMILY